jgi:hypothetical protein
MGLISNGTTIFDNGSMASGFGSSLNFISKATASASASIEFTSGIDSTYKEYVFYFHSIHPATDGAKLSVNFSIDSGSNYNVTKTTSFFRASHYEDGSDATLGYRTGQDLAQSTGEQELTDSVGNDNDQSTSGYLHLFNPSSTTFVKHFISKTNASHGINISQNHYIAGYCNTTSAVDGIRFKFSSGNIDSGEILLFGVS